MKQKGMNLLERLHGKILHHVRSRGGDLEEMTTPRSRGVMEMSQSAEITSVGKSKTNLHESGRRSSMDRHPFDISFDTRLGERLA